ncbi:MAG: TatD family hydrolase [Polyangia bacterium]|jgi:TatD DNase family protein
MWIDSHCHLEPDDFLRQTETGPVDDRDAVVARARQAQVTRFVVIGSGGSEREARNALSYAVRDASMFAAVGIHPHDASAVISRKMPKSEQPQLLGEELWDEIASLSAHTRVVAVGETGLDYHYNHSSPEEQVTLLRRFVRLAQSLHKPLVLHIRDAHAQAMEILAQEGGSPAGGVVHCFTGGPQEATEWLRLGFAISLSGIVTFKSAASIQEAAKLVPKGRLLLETDCPYLAPVPMRGRRNEPAYLVHTAEFVARLRGESQAELSEHTRSATEKTFGLPAQ